MVGYSSSELEGRKGIINLDSCIEEILVKPGPAALGLPARSWGFSVGLGVEVPAASSMEGLSCHRR